MLQMAMMSLACSQDTWRTVRVGWLVLRHAAALALQALAAARRCAAERREGQALDARMRRDVGLGPGGADALARKPSWRA